MACRDWNVIDGFLSKALRSTSEQWTPWSAPDDDDYLETDAIWGPFLPSDVAQRELSCVCVCLLVGFCVRRCHNSAALTQPFLPVSCDVRAGVPHICHRCWPLSSNAYILCEGVVVLVASWSDVCFVDTNRCKLETTLKMVSFNWCVVCIKNTSSINSGVPWLLQSLPYSVMEHWATLLQW